MYLKSLGVEIADVGSWVLGRTERGQSLGKATVPSPPTSPTPSEWVPAAGRGEQGNDRRQVRGMDCTGSRSALRPSKEKGKIMLDMGWGVVYTAYRVV